MTRGVGFYLVGSLVLVSLAGCGRGFFQSAEREPWRAEAEVACLKSGAVKENPDLVRISPISGPGVCGAQFPLKVAALGESSGTFGFADDDLRPPASIGNQPRWPVAPPILEEIYNMEDALAFGGCCISLLNHADRVTAACLAQLVNVIAPIMTETGGPAWRQTIFHPFAQASRFAHGQVLRANVESDSFSATGQHSLSNLLATVIYDETSGRIAVFALNRSTDATNLTVDLPGFGKRRLLFASELHHQNLKAENTLAAPHTVEPRTREDVTASADGIHARLEPLSWNVFVTEPA